MNELLIYSDIGESMFYDSVSAKSVKARLDDIGDGAELSVRINSPGGDVFDGFAIFNMLNQRSGPTTVYIDGLAASAASIIAMAGDEIIMAENSMMMIHDPWTMMVGDSRDMRETADLLDKIKGSIVTTYQTKTTLDADAIETMMAAETWFNAAEAIENGFATSTMAGGRGVENLAKPWINNAPKPDAIPEGEAREAYRVAINRRRLALLD